MSQKRPDKTAARQLQREFPDWAYTAILAKVREATDLGLRGEQLLAAVRIELINLSACPDTVAQLAFLTREEAQRALGSSPPPSTEAPCKPGLETSSAPCLSPKGRRL